MDLPELFKDFLESQKKPASKLTIKNYVADINQFIRWYESTFQAEFTPSSLTPELIKKYTLAKTSISAKSYERHLSSLRKFSTFLVQKGHIKTSPFALSSLSRLPLDPPLRGPFANPDPFHLKGFKDYLYVYNASDLTIKNYINDIRQFASWCAKTHGNTQTRTQTDTDIRVDPRSDPFGSVSLSLINSTLLEEYRQYLISGESSSLSPIGGSNNNNLAMRHHEMDSTLVVQQFSNRSLSPASVNRKLSSLRRYISFAQNQGLIREGQGLLPSNILPAGQTGLPAGKAGSVRGVSPEQPPVSPVIASEQSERSNLSSGIATSSRQGATPPSNSAGRRNDIEATNDAHSNATMKQCNNESSQLSASNNNAMQTTHYPLPTTHYSRFAPFRLLQKLGTLTTLAFDATIVAGTAIALEKLHYLSWIATGKQIFVTQKNTLTRTLKNTDFRVLPRSVPRSSVLKTLTSTEVAKLPLHHKIYYHARFTRPDWYHRYHQYALAHYINFAILIILMSALGFGMYNSVFNEAQQNKSLAAPPTAPPRIMSFQGRLTDSSDNPITSAKDLRFSIYNDLSASGGALLWQETQVITGDQDGIFSVLLGSSTTIPASVFTDNSTLYLGVTVQSDPELTPRQQIATVAFATNSETLQGLYPITAGGAGQTNVVLALDSSGNLTIGGSANPTFSATGGTYTLSGNVLSLQTTSGSNGNVNLTPDGLGKIDLQKPIQNSTNNNNVTTARGAVEINDLFAILATSSGQSAFTLNQNSTGPLISASTSGVARFTVDNAGKGYLSQSLGIGTTAPANGLYVYSGGANAGYIDSPSASYTQFHVVNSSTNGRDWSFIISGQNAVAPAGPSGSFGILDATGGSNRFTILTGGNVGIGSTNPTSFKLEVNGNVGPSVDSTYDLGSASLRWNNLYVNNIIGAVTGTSGYFQRNNGALAPTYITDDLLLGATSTASAKFGFINVASGTPTATISGNLSLQVPTGANPATKLNILNGGTFGIRTSAGGDGGLNERLTVLNNGNVGIGTTAPGDLFSVNSTSVTSNIVASFNNTSNNAGLVINSSASNNPYVELRQAGNARTQFGYSNLGFAYIGNGTAIDQLTVNRTSGNVGIGTTAALGLLNVNGSTTTAQGQTLVQLNQTGTADILTASASGVTKFLIANTGNTTISNTGGTGATALILNTSNQTNSNSAIRWTNSAGTAQAGIGSYFNIADIGNLEFLNGATTNMILSSSGNLGIGTTAPGQKLSVAGVIAGQSVAGAGDVLLVGNDAKIVDVDVANVLGIYSQTTPTEGGILLGSGGPTIYGKSGNVGIGSTTPTAKLDVTGDASVSASLVFGTAGTNTIDVLNGDSLNFATSPGGDAGLTTKLTLASNGNLGIGSTTPGARLDLVSSGTTTNGFNLTANSLTTGYGAYLSSTSTGLTTGGLLNLDWSPGSSTTATGDLFSLNIGANGTLGNIFNVKDNSSSVFSISQAQLTSNIPAQFNAAGDVSIAYDLNFTNPTASYIKSQAPLYIEAGKNYNSDPLTLRTYNAGNVIVDSQAFVTNYAATVSGQLVIGTSTAPANIGNFYLTNSAVFGKALAILNQTESADIFTASSSGVNKFSISNAGVLTAPNYTTNGGLLYTNGSGTVAQTGAGTGTQCLLGGTTPTWGLCSTGGGITGSGTLNYIPKFTPDGSTIGNSTIFDNGNVGVGTTTPLGKFQVYGSTTTAQGQALAQIIQNSTGDIFTASAGATTRFVINNDGNVGIGTGNPVRALQITSSTSPEVVYQNSGAAANTGYWRNILGTDGTFRLQAINDAFSSATTGIEFYRSGSTVTYVNFPTGNIGIGSTTPTALFDVAGSASISGTLAFRGTTDPKLDILNAEAFGIRFSAGGTAGLNEQFTILANGNVGIGTTAPGQKLSVAGVIAGQSVAGAGDVLLVGNDAKIVDVDVANVLGIYSQTTPTEGGILLGSGGPTIYGKSGNVGIGTTAPVTKVQLAGGDFSIQNSRYVAFRTADDTTYAGSIVADSSNALTISNTYQALNLKTVGAYPITFSTTNSERLRIDSAGNVGIGTTTPLGLFNIDGKATGKALAIFNQNGGDQAIFTASKSGVTKFLVDTSGNVGIGLTSLRAALDISGNASLSGDLYFTGSTNTILTLNGGDLRFNVSPGGGTGSEALRINNASGNIAIGTTASSLFKVQVAGSIGPNTDDTYDLGSSAKRWRDLYLGPASLHIGTDANEAVISYNTASNFLGINPSGDGTPEITIDDSGNLGIGTTTAASYPLYVNGNGYVNGDLTVTGNLTAGSTGTSGFWQRNAGALAPANITDDLLLGGTATSTAKFAFINNIGSGSPTASISSNLSLVVPTGANPAAKLNILNGGTFGIRNSVGGDGTLSERLTILNNGNVGIGTTAPGAKLEVNGGDIKIVDSGGTAGFIYGYDTNHGIYFREGATDKINYYEYGGTLAAGAGHKFYTGGVKASQTLKLQIANDGTYIAGNVGIGSTAPTTPLDVVGAIKGSSTVTAGTYFRASNGSTTTAYGFTSFPTTGMSTNGNGSVLFYENGNNQAVIDGSGLILTAGQIRASNGLEYFKFTTNGTAVNELTLANAATGVAPALTATGDDTNIDLKIDGKGSGKVQIGNTSTGNIELAGGSAATGCTVENSTGNLVCSGTISGSGSVGYWQRALGALSPTNITDDLLLGGTATSTAKFAFINNIGSGSPTASISSNLSLVVPTGANPAAKLNILNGGTFGIRTSPGGDAGATERLTVLNNGNVGIGTTAPGAILQVNKLNGSTNTGLIVYGSDTGSGTTIANFLDWNGTSRLYLRGDGNVGIGTTNPAYGKLQVTGGDIVLDGASANGGELTVTTSGFGIIGASRRLNYGDLLLGYNLRGQAGDDSYYTNNTHAAAGYGGIDLGYQGMIRFYSASGATTAGSSVTPTEAMRINVGGNVGIGSVTPGAKLDVTGNIKASTTIAAGTTLQGAATALSGDVLLIGNDTKLVDIDVSNTTAIYGIADTTVAALRLGSSGNTTISSIANAASYFNNGGNVGIGNANPAFFKLELTGSIGPSANDTYDLGSSTKIWNDVYADRVCFDGASDCITSGATIGGYWQRALGALSPANITDDLLLGGTATSTAKFAFINNIGSGSPTASISANSGNNATYLTGGGTLATTNMQGLTLGGATTGSISLAAGSATSALFVANGGNVGIGTTSPFAPLTVLGYQDEAGERGILALSRSTAPAKRLIMGYAATGDYSYIQSVETLVTTYPLALNPMGGNVGIGSTAPAAKLDIDTASNTLGLRLRGTAETTEIGDIYVGSTGELVLSTANTGDTDAYIEVNAEDDNYGLIIRDSNTGNGVYSNLYMNDAATDYLNINVGASNSTAGLVLQTGGNVGIGTTNPVTKLQVSSKVSDDNSYAYDANSLMVIHQTPTATATLNDPKTTLMLARQGTSGQAYGAAAAFNLSRYENNSVNSRTRLDISLAHASFDPTTNTVMTLLSSGNVGIGTTAPGAKLDIDTGSNTLGLRLRGTAETTEIGDIYVGSGGQLVLSTANTGGANAWVEADAEDDTYGFILRDSNTGSTVYSNFYTNDAATDYLNINVGATNATAGLVLQTGGNVGIGSTTPEAKLDVNNDSGIRLSTWGGWGQTYSAASQVIGSNIYVNPSDTVSRQIRSINTHGTYGHAYMEFYGGDIVFNAETAASTADAIVVPQERMRIDGSNGYVGIGSTAPVAPLNVVNSAALNGSSQYGAYFNQTYTGEATANKATYGINNALTINGTDGQFSNTAYGNYNNTILSSGNTIDGIYGVLSQVVNNSNALGSTSVTATTAAALRGYIYNNATSGVITNQYGVLADSFNNSTGTVTNIFGSYNQAYNSNATGTVTTAYGTRTLAFTNIANSSIGTAYGLYSSVSTASATTTGGINTGIAGRFEITSPMNTTAYGVFSNVTGVTTGTNYGVYVNTTGSVTNNYGIRVTGTPAAGGNYGLYVDAAAQSYFAGNVGIGMAVPVSRLTLSGNATGATEITLAANANTGRTTYLTGDYSLVGTSATAAGSYPFNEAGNLILQSRAATAGRDIVFATGTTPTTRMVVDRNGNVGIGTTAPTFQLDLNGSGGVFGTSDKALLRLANTDTTATNNVSAIQFSANRTGAIQTPLASVSAILTNNGATTYTGALAFSTAGTAAIPTERLRIDGAGNVGIGTTGPGTQLQVGGTTNFQTGSDFTGTVFGGGSRAAWQLTDGTIKVYSQVADRGYFGTLSNHSLTLQTNGTNRMQISAAGGYSLGNTYNTTDPGANNVIIEGNVGIGTTVVSGALFSIENSAGGVEIQGNSENMFNLYSQSSMTFRIDSDNDTTNTYDFYNGANTSVVNIDESGNLQIDGSLTVDGGGINSATDITLNPTGGQVFLADTDTLAIGGHAGAAYNAISNSGGSPTNPNVTADNDLYVQGDIDVGGTLYVGGTQIANYWTRTAGNLSPATVNDTLSATTSAATALTITQTGAFDVVRFEDQASDTTPFIIDQSGNVGIGTTTPETKLHIAAGDLLLGNTQKIFMENAGGTNIRILDVDSGPNLNIGRDDNLGVIQTFGPVLLYDDAASPALGIYLDPTTNVANYFNNGGNLGIGTTSPIGRLDVSSVATYNAEAGGLHVSNSSTSPNKVVQIGFDNAIDAGFIRAYHSGTGTKPLLLQADAGNVGIGTTNPTGLLQVGSTAGHYIKYENNARFADYYSTETVPRWSVEIDKIGSGLSAYTLAQAGATSVDANGVAFGIAASRTLGLYTSNGTALTERLRIDSTGNIGIGTTAPIAGLDVREGTVLRSTTSTTVPTAPIASNAAEFVISANSLVTIGESVEGNANPQIVLYRTSSGFKSGRASRIYSPDSLGTLQFDIGSNGDLPYGAELYNNIMTLKSTGNVGIGSTAPTQKLDVAGNIALQAAGNIDTNAAGALTIGSTTQTGLTLGRVGAATTINGASLTVGPTAWTATPTISGLITATSGLTANGALTANNTFTLGDNGDTGSINTSDWDINTTGDMSGIGSIALNGAFTQTGAVALSTGTGAVSLNGAVTAALTLAVTGATTLNGAVTLGDAITDNITFTGRVAQDSDIIPITATGTNDLGTSTLLWDNIYVDQICFDGAVDCMTTSGGYWTRSAGNLHPTTLNDTLSATSSASTVATFTTNNPAGTLTNNTLIQHTGAGTVTNLLNLTQSAGAATTALAINGTFTNLINATNFTLTNAGNLDTAGTLTAGTANAFTVAATGDITTVTNETINGIDISAGAVSDVTTLTSSGSTTIGTGASSANTMGAGSSSTNVIGSVTTPGALTLHGATTLDNTFTVSGANLTSLGGNLTVSGTAWTATPTISGLITATSGLTANGALTANNTFTLGDNGDTGSINTSDWDIDATGVMTGIGNITTNGGYTQSGATLNTFTGNVDATSGLDVTGASLTVGTSYSWTTGGVINTEKFEDTTNAAYYLDPANATTSLLVNGNVGIGTTIPRAKLDIVGDASISAGLVFGVAGTNTIDILNGDRLDFQTSPGGDAGLAIRLSLTSNGNVGIGVTAPNAPLSIAGTAGTSSTSFSSFGGQKWRMQQNASDETNSGVFDYRGFDATALSFVGAGTTAQNRLIRLFDAVGINIAPSTTQALKVDGTNMTYSAIFTTGNVGIGSTAPRAVLDVSGNASFSADMYYYGASPTTIVTQNDSDIRWNQSPGGGGGTQRMRIHKGVLIVGTDTSIVTTNLGAGSVEIDDGTLCVSNGSDDCDDAARTKGNIYAQSATVTAIDVAETYPSKDNAMQAGELVMADQNNAEYVVRSEGSYQPNIIGIISTKPGLLLGGFGDEEKRFGNDKKYPIALAGRVPVKVSTINGLIHKGDSLTSSSIPGVAMKSTRPGQAVAKALDDYLVSDPNTVGSIVALVNISWYDPTVKMASSGNLNIAGVDENSFTAWAGQYKFENKAGFAEAIIAKLTAGIVKTQQLVVSGSATFLGSIQANTINASSIAVNSMTFAGQSLHDYILDVVSNSPLAINNTQGITSPIANIDQINTNIISPLAGTEVKVAGNLVVGHPELDSGSPALTVNGSASISGSLNATDASIAGTLRADRIIANDIEGLDARIANLTASTAAITNIYNVYNTASESGNIAQASDSGNFAYSPDAATSLITSNLYAGVADISSLSAALAYVPGLSAETATINQGLMVFGTTSLSDTSVAGQLSVGGSLIIADNSINVLGSTFEIQPLRQGNISFEGGLVSIDTDGNLTVNGNASFASNVSVDGVLSARIVSPVPDSDLIIQLPGGASDQGTLAVDRPGVIVKNGSGSAVLKITDVGDIIASGAALATQFQVVRGVSADTSNITSVATASAGTAIIKQGQLERTIISPYVTDKSLIYITATTDTNGLTPFVARQVAEDPSASSGPVKGSFTIRIPVLQTKDVKINWWIIN